ncbi:hypothetical protein NF699_02555 [Sphingomonadaceae bacterium OTU29LAMAA1]|nr:hypothetical protein NF699_02555 [Sphingomonadaceae bacterium OTU29LAMAA1]
MVDGIGVTTPSSKANASTASVSQVTTPDFLQLLLAQFKYQDPFVPQDPTKSVGELAGLAQLSTLQDISATLQQLANRSGGIDVGSWVGRTALVETGTAVAMKTGSYAGQIRTASDADVDVSFFGSDGQLLETLHVPAPVAAGQSFSWDTSDRDGMPVTVVASSAAKPIAIALWLPITGATRPGAGDQAVETPVGHFAPGAVLALG